MNPFARGRWPHRLTLDGRSAVASRRQTQIRLITGAEAHRVLSARPAEVIALVTAAYRLQGAAGPPVGPRRPLSDGLSPQQRAVLATACGPSWADGQEWLPGRREHATPALPGAGARLLVLLDPRSGLPVACVERATVSAARTAATAVIGADALVLARGRERPRRIGFLGTGPAARSTYDYLAGTGWSFDAVLVHDPRLGRAESFAWSATPVRSAADLVRGSDLVVRAPGAAEPPRHAGRPLMLDLSSRGLAVLAAHLVPPESRSTVFSPAGFTALDLTLGGYVHDQRPGSEGTPS